jgi:hypothetical protein
MSTAELIWNGIAAFLTLCIFSFLYKDNPFYRLAEHLVVGVSAGYFAIILVYNGLIPKLINPVFRQGRLYYLLPGLLGVFMWTRFSKKWSWLSRYSIAAYMGVATGVAIPLYMYTYVIRQAQATMAPVGLTSVPLINNLLVAIGVISGLFYFYFSKAHAGAMGVISRIGIWILMVGFGAGFGLTVMGRISLLAERVLFLKDYFSQLF